MHFNKNMYRAIFTAIVLLPTCVFAAAPNPDEKSANYNVVLISLVTLMLVLLFVIGTLGNVLRQLTIVVRDKGRKERQGISNVVKALFCIALFNLPVLHLAAANPEGAKQWSALPSGISGIPTADYYTIITILILEITVIFALLINIGTLIRVIKNKPELLPAVKVVIKKSWFWDKFNAAATIEREKDILLDHNYDGIQELDNSLPPWWKYGFYLTIIIGIIYLYRFHVSHDGLSQQEEFVVEMQKGEEEKAAYLAKSANNIDETSVVLLTDAGSIGEGHEIFEKNCSPCHLADGGGNVGPNLTDDYWLHGGGIKDIFKSVKYGWQDKGMKSWKDDLSPKQIQQVASFIKSLKGTHPVTPKAPQGDIYIEASQGDGKSKADSTKVTSNDNTWRAEVVKATK